MAPEFHDGMTLGEARVRMRRHVERGRKCALCGQFAKVYKRSIHATMARELIHFYRRAGIGEWFDLPLLAGEISGRRRAYTGDSAKLRYWGLMEEAEAKREDGGPAGWWRVTPAGERFVLLQSRVSKHARVYDGRCLGLIGEPVSIVDCLGDKFDYRELMDR